MQRLLRAALAAAALLGAARAADPGPLPAPGEALDVPVELLEAGSLQLDVATGTWTVEGGTWLRRGDLSLRAAGGRWDPATGELTARGGVVVTEPGRILTADVLEVGRGGTIDARGVHAYLKDNPLDLSRCTTEAEGAVQGRNRVAFAGDRLSGRRGDPAVRFEGARLTACDCVDGPPSWEIRATSADVVPGDRATMTWPVLYVTPRFLGIDHLVPVFALPWGYLPIAERKTGLLIPQLVFDRNGMTLGLPVFLALSRSWDATVTPEWITGPSAAQLAQDQRGVRGPGLGLELRWAPSADAAGYFRSHLVASTLSDWPAGAWQPPGPDRIAFQLRHQQSVGDAWELAADLSAVGDPYTVTDFTGDVLLRGAAYRRSALSLSHRFRDLLVAAGTEYLEPLIGLDSGDPLRRAPFGWFGTDLSAFHRVAFASATLLPVALAGPVRLSAHAAVDRFAPLRGTTSDGGTDGMGPGDQGWGTAALDADRNPSIRHPDADGTERNGRWDPGERLAATRGLLRVELEAPVPVGAWALATPWLAATGAAYAFDGSRPAAGTARAAGGLALSTELSRRHGEGSARFLHAVAPRVEWRFGTSPAGGGLPSGLAYDDRDVAPAAASADAIAPARALSATPEAGFQQLRLALRNRLAAAGAGGPSADLDVGQDLDLRGGRLAETWAQLGLRYGLVAADATARFYAFGASRPAGSPTAPFASWLDGASELRATLKVGTPVHDLHFGFVALGPGGSQRLAAGVDPLFDPRPIGLDPVAQGSAGFRTRWSAAVLTYDLEFNARRWAQPLVVGGPTDPHVFQQTARLTWESPCRCFRLGVTAALRDGRTLPDLGLIFDLGQGADQRPPI